MIKNTENHYGSVSRFLHWFMALCYIGLVIVGISMTDLEPSPFKMIVYTLHKSMGTLMMAFVLFRVYWVLTNTKPSYAQSTPKVQILLARSTHLLLYLFIVLMPLSGMGMSLLGGHDINFFWLFTIPSPGKHDLASIFYQIHGYGYIVLTGLFIVHISAALYHHVWLKDNILMRMIRG